MALYSNTGQAPLPFGAPTAKYYRWAAFEYWINATYSALNPKLSSEPIPMCVRMGVCHDWSPESWKDDDACIIGDSAFARINSNGEQRPAQHAAARSPIVSRAVKFDCRTGKRKSKK